MPSPVQPSGAPESATTRAADGPAIDGLTAAEIWTPATAAEAADLLAAAAAGGLAVAPVGGGTALGLGNPPERLDALLSTIHLDGILAYEPDDLVLSVGAGARFGDVQAVLAEHGQGLPLEAPRDADATIGGLIASALAGPRRLGSGTLRDLLIGMSVASPNGAVAKAGGMVVKNVSGYDLPRLHHGALGTLGLIVSANFKVLPLTRAEATLLLATDSPTRAFGAAARVRAGQIQPLALEVARLDGTWHTAVRVAGRTDTVHHLGEAMSYLLGGGPRRLDAEESAAWWRAYVDAQAINTGGSDALIRAAARPRDTAELALAVRAAVAEAGADLCLLAASPGLGTVTVRLSWRDSGSAEQLRQLQAALAARADHVTILAAPPAWKAGLDVWGPALATLPLMRALKAEFDPARVLNPGRFAGGI